MLAYVSAPLDRPLRVSGVPVVNLVAATSGPDADWVVKLIDVYPDGSAAAAGYQFPVAMDIFRARYRGDPAKPLPLTRGKAERYRFALPAANHVFLPGHRIMVQVQSSWFPLYDRNPQTFVPNIFFAKTSDYKKATQSVMVSGRQESYVTIPLAP